MSQASKAESANPLNVTAASAVLEIEDLKTHFFTAAGRGEGGGRRVLFRAQRRDARRGGRVRLRQERDGPLDPAARCRSARPDRRRRRPLRGPEPARSRSETAWRTIRGNEISMIFQEPMTSLNPLFTVGHQISRGDRRAPGRGPARGHADGRRHAAARVDTAARAARAQLSAPDVRRHAPARHDRDGAVVQSQGADRRRADHGARRDDPGADPRRSCASCSRPMAWPSSSSPTTWAWWPRTPTA